MKTSSLFVTLFLFIIVLGSSPFAEAKVNPTITTVTTVYAISTEGVGKPLGTLTIHDTTRGLVIVPNLKGLPSGVHGFHLHQNADCSPGMKDDKITAGLSAGGHFDPDHTSSHEGPSGEGHRGDLPVLTVDAKGTAHQPLLVPHLKLTDITGHAFVIHEGGDNYSDQPMPLGGGGNRIACAVVF